MTFYSKPEPEQCFGKSNRSGYNLTYFTGTEKPLNQFCHDKNKTGTEMTVSTLWQ